MTITPVQRRSVVLALGLLWSQALCSYAATAKPKVGPKTTSKAAFPFKINLSPKSGTIVDSFSPNRNASPYLPPQFILIQDVHCNQHVQYAISRVLRDLKKEGLLPSRIAIEGAAGPVDINALQRYKDRQVRRKVADDLMTQGQMTGAMHFVVTEGSGDLYGVETARLYDAAVDIFRKSYPARTRLSRKLEKMDAGLDLLASDPKLAGKASFLSQDIQVIRRLVDQRLTPEEVYPVFNQAIFAVDHLENLLAGKVKQELLEPVSAAANFYALAFLRDDALFENAVELGERDRQCSTVLVAGGFHTAGVAQRLKSHGYSYIVITPQVKAYNPGEERLYVERLLGYRIASNPNISNWEVPTLSSGHNLNAVSMSKALRKLLPRVEFSMPPTRDIFTALDAYKVPSAVKLALQQERSRILLPMLAEKTARLQLVQASHID